MITPALEVTGYVKNFTTYPDGSMEALVCLTTGHTAVVGIDERFCADDVHDMMSGNPVKVQFDISDPHDPGKIVYVESRREILA